jgi:D-glycero-alpha-D-manno-heptose-7-phosphate kinase
MGVDAFLVRAEAPTRIDFAGGPSDVDPFKSTEGGCVVNSTLSLKATVWVSNARHPSDLLISSPENSFKGSLSDVRYIEERDPLRLIKATIGYAKYNLGLHIRVTSDVPEGSGLGASASLTVALLAALRKIQGVSRENLELANEALNIENSIMQNLSGGQDQYAAALGGTNLLKFDSDGVYVQPVRVKEGTLSELESRSTLCYSGATRKSGEILKQIMRLYLSGDPRTVESIREMKSIATEMAVSLRAGEVDEFGRLLAQASERQLGLHPLIAPRPVRDMMCLVSPEWITASRMLGAGDGGCVFIFSKPGCKPLVDRVLKDRGFLLLPFSFSSGGVQAM